VDSLTVEAVRERGKRDLYPTEILERCDSALILFAAAFLGEQDAAWIEEAGLLATCVDNDAARLAEMETLYPESWRFVVADVYEYANSEVFIRDLVSVDCPSDQFDRAAQHLNLFCTLARVAVVLGTAPGQRVTAPDGWRRTRTVRRSPIANWTVLERV
jgi:hypothetical protein